MDSEFLWIGGALAMAMVMAVAGGNAEREKFMRGCLADRKEYECTAMWRAGESHTTVMPIPVIINH